ncbi:MAG: hypothetical protein E7214_07585 [Clostridium sp.]|nr:hypothetical protein [Clostridium sp.]
MSTFLVPITNDFFNNIIKIKFKNVLDGFNNYPSYTIMSNNKTNEIKEEIITKFILKVFKINNNLCYIDFYISKLQKEDINNLIKLTPNEDKDILIQNINLKHDGIYYKVDNKELIPFLVRLSTREIFFITFYFNKIPITIWGNYNMEFPCFFENENDMKFYKDLWKKLDE